MKIYVLGNSLVKKDSGPLKLIPALEKTFPDLKFVKVDPNENFNPAVEKQLLIMDTVKGISKVKLFTKLDEFTSGKNISPHDYDLLFHLKLLEKINRLPKKISIIGIPSRKDPLKLIPELCRIITSLLQENEQHRRYKDRKL